MGTRNTYCRGRGKRDVTAASPSVEAEYIRSGAVYESQQQRYCWYNDDGLLHREDGPAVIFTKGNEDEGMQEWWIHGKLHRLNGPARISSSGMQEWFWEGNLHRAGDLPAHIDGEGEQHWFVHGKRHRGDGLPAIIQANGSREWWVNGEVHRDWTGDLPAKHRVFGDGTVEDEWFKRGIRHREDDLPAVINSAGWQEWWYFGNRHRENDLPATVAENGIQSWFVRGKCHRDNGPAIIGPNGYEEWYVNGHRHRENEPAVIQQNGIREYWSAGKRHREDGPAVIYPDGRQEWWFQGSQCAGEQGLRQRQQLDDLRPSGQADSLETALLQPRR